jgi:hypothetical protein
MNIGDRVVWLNPIVTPALKGGVWVIDELVDEVATIRRLDRIVPNQNVQIKNLVGALA